MEIAAMKKLKKPQFTNFQTLFLKKILAFLLIFLQALHAMPLLLISSVYAADFTARQAKRDAPGPFAAAPILGFDKR